MRLEQGAGIMDRITTEQIILAAVGAAGPVGDDRPGWLDRVSDLAAEITVLCSDRSRVARRVQGIANSKVFTATIVGGKLEPSSTRGVVNLRTKATEQHPDSIEQARTTRTDNPDGAAMWARLKQLKGHRVVVWVEVQEYNGGQGKVRVVQHVEDLGMESSAESAA
ncbi:MAG: hypothetical protein M0Z95_04985 [Actinomycetota bacterium]|jgi:hypothetical protein|nr:hypothetical protein [Actinomycetota bacterium]